jgi:flavodoxin
MKNSCSLIAAVVLIIFCTCISASADTNFYNINIQYGAEKVVIPEYLKADEKTRDAIITVAEFIDARQVADKNIIGQVRERDETRVSIFPKDVLPTRAVANGIKEYLKKAGYKVDDKIVQWDLKEATMPKGKGKVIIGGNIEALEITCWRGVFSHNYKASVKLNVFFADLAKGKILYTSKVESASSRDDISFSEEELGGQLSTALGDAIQKIFDDKAVAQKIKEAIIQ